jgi:hypothetical protein
MNSNEATIHKFYTAFQNKDYSAMQDCYSDNAIFSDPVFENLSARQVKAMWEMFCKRGAVRIEFTNVKAGAESGSAQWTAYYNFSVTGRDVINRISAEFAFIDGKIISHRDSFSFYEWARQAFGITGLILGWTPFFKNKVKATALKNLEKFMSEKNE